MIYNIGVCKICRQGFLEIVKDENSGIMYVCCDDCEAEWSTPEDAILGQNGTRGKYGKICYPKYDEINKIGWFKYII